MTLVGPMNFGKSICEVNVLHRFVKLWFLDKMQVYVCLFLKIDLAFEIVMAP
jgi:hypothetical protein